MCFKDFYLGHITVAVINIYKRKNSCFINFFIKNGYKKNTITRTAKKYLKNTNKPEHKYANSDNNYKHTIILPWRPISNYTKLYGEFKKKGIKTCLKSISKSVLEIWNQFYVRIDQNFCEIFLLEYISYIVLDNHHILVKQKRKCYPEKYSVKID